MNAWHSVWDSRWWWMKFILKISSKPATTRNNLSRHWVCMKSLWRWKKWKKKFNQSKLNGFDISTWCGAHAVELKMYMKLKSQQIVMMTEETRWMGRIIKLFFSRCSREIYIVLLARKIWQIENLQIQLILDLDCIDCCQLPNLIWKYLTTLFPYLYRCHATSIPTLQWLYQPIQHRRCVNSALQCVFLSLTFHFLLPLRHAEGSKSHVYCSFVSSETSNNVFFVWINIDMKSARSMLCERKSHTMFPVAACWHALRVWNRHKIE